MSESIERNVTPYAQILFDKGIVADNKKIVFTIDNILSAEECKNLIEQTEEKGYESALVNIGFGRQKFMPDVRKSDRCIVDDENMGQMFWERIKDHIPKVDGYEAVGLNERMRFLRYDKGNYFCPHFDGSYVRPDGSELSLITFFLYLNDGFEGGASTFMHPLNDNIIVPCPPKTGRVLIFEHRIFHEGSLLIKGRKYALRTDIMYKKTTE